VLSSGQRGVELAEAALRLLPDEYRYARGLALVFLAMHMQSLGQKREAEERLRLAALRALSSDAFSARILFAQWALAWMAGEIASAGAVIERFLAVSQDAGLMVSLCWAHTYAGERHLEINELERAIEHFEVVVSHAHLTNFRCQVIARMQLALAQQASGRPEQADAVMRNLRAHARAVQIFAHWPQFDALEARLWLLRGDVTNAARWLQTSIRPNPGLEFLGPEYPRLTRAQILIAQRSPEALDEAFVLLRELRCETETRHLHYAQAKVMAVQASALYALNRSDEALRVMEKAVQIGERGGLIRAFADLGPDVLTVLRALADCTEPGSMRRAYLDRLIAAFGVAPVAPSVLTLREIEVLELLGKRRSDKEIAESLFVSRSTVAKHTASIYRKLGVGNRREAVARARALGVLSGTA